MKYRAALSQLRNDLAAIKAAAPTARLEFYDADGDDLYAGVVSYGGSMLPDLYRLPRELEMDAWKAMIKREVRA